jgi:mitochondrial fission protein ELM1
MLKKLAKALVLNVLMKGIVGVDAKDISEAPRAKVLAAASFVVVTKDIDEDTLSVLTSKMSEKHL